MRGENMFFSEEIKKLRKRLFMSQTAFAQELGVSYTTVNRWEMGKAKPTYKTMKLIDDYCKEKGIEFDIHESLTQEK
jgi:DNA-binding transcriptional regulator YiaG